MVLVTIFENGKTHEKTKVELNFPLSVKDRIGIYKSTSSKFDDERGDKIYLLPSESREKELAKILSEYGIEPTEDNKFQLDDMGTPEDIIRYFEENYNKLAKRAARIDFLSKWSDYWDDFFGDYTAAMREILVNFVPGTGYSLKISDPEYEEEKPPTPPPPEYPKDITRAPYTFKVYSPAEERQMKDFMGIDPPGLGLDEYLASRTEAQLLGWRDYWVGIWTDYKRDDMVNWVTDKYNSLVTIPEYRVLPKPPEGWTEEAYNLYKRLDEACAEKDKDGILSVLREMLVTEMSPAIVLASVLAIVGVVSLIVTIIGTYPFAAFLYEETLQTIDMAIYTAQREGRWDLAAKALAKKKEILDIDGIESFMGAIPFVNVVAAAGKFMEASMVKYEIDEALIAEKQAAVAEPVPGDFEGYVKSLDAGTPDSSKLPNPTGLIINSSPSGADVKIVEIPMTFIPTPLRLIPIGPGSYTVTVTLPNYVAETRIINVPEGWTVTEDFYLKPITPPERASISVISIPDKANVYIDDVLYTYPTNTVIGDLDAGAYMIRVEKTGYESAEKRITVGEGESRSTTFELVAVEVPPEKGTLRASSVPSGASVIIAGVVRGETPIDIELGPGSYSVTFKLDGYEELTRTTIIKAGETSVLSVKLEEEEEEVPPTPPIPPGKGHLLIDVAPDYVELSLAGESLGTLPPPGKYEVDLDPGSYDFTFDKDGYYSTTRTAIIRSNQTTTLMVSLIKIAKLKKLWRVDVSAVDTIGTSLSAKILVDESFTGKWTPDYILLNPGEYVFKIIKSGYIPAEIPMTLEAIE